MWEEYSAQKSINLSVQWLGKTWAKITQRTIETCDENSGYESQEKLYYCFHNI